MRKLDKSVVKISSTIPVFFVDTKILSQRAGAIPHVLVSYCVTLMIRQVR